MDKTVLIEQTSRDLRAVCKYCREDLAIVEPGITFQSIHSLPIFKGNLDQLGRYCVLTLRMKCRETAASVVQSAGYCAGRDIDSVPAETVIAFTGHKCSVYDEFDCIHLLTFLFLVKLFLIL